MFYCNIYRPPYKYIMCMHRKMLCALIKINECLFIYYGTEYVV